MLGRGLEARPEQRGLALCPQRRGEDLPAHQLHDQRLPGRVHPHRVSAPGGGSAAGRRRAPLAGGGGVSRLVGWGQGAAKARGPGSLRALDLG